MTNSGKVREINFKFIRSEVKVWSKTYDCRNKGTNLSPAKLSLFSTKYLLFISSDFPFIASLIIQASYSTTNTDEKLQTNQPS